MNPKILLNRPAIRGHELRQGIEAFAHHVCSGLKLRPVTVQWQAGITAAINANGAMLLAAVRDDALIHRALVLKYLGFVVHELLHRRYSDFAVRPNNSDPKTLRIYHNAIEDAWIERRAIRSGLLGNIESLLVGLLRGMTDRARAEVQDWTDPAQYPFALAVFCRQYSGVSVPLAQGLAPIFAEASRRIDQCQTSTDTMDVARWVLDQLRTLPEPQQDQQQQEDPQQEDPQQEDPQQGQQQGEPQDQQQQEGEQQGEGEGEGEGEQEGAGEGAGEGAEQSPGPARPASGNERAREVEPTLEAPKDAGSIGTFTRERSIKPPGRHLYPSPMRDLQPVTAPRLEAEVRRLFEDSGSTLFQQNRKAGSINVGSLGRFGTTDRLFKQRRDIEGIDSAVVIVLDVSGSMFAAAGRIRAALPTAALLIRVLQRAGVAVAMVTFGDVSSLAIPFGTPTPKALETLRRIDSGGSTNDYAALKQAHDMLLARPESRKVCFVLTDGMGEADAAKEQVNAGTNLGITTIGIGMELDVSEVYPISVTVNRLAELATASLAKIKLAA